MVKKKAIALVVSLCVWATPLISNPSVQQTFKEGLAFEQKRLFGDAYSHYLKLGTAQIERLNQGEILPRDSFPILSSVLFRLSIVTAKRNMSTPMPLVDQLESYEYTHELLESYLATIADYQTKNPIPSDAFSNVFFARAYNRVAWANTLVQGILWKQYMIQPPIIAGNMLEEAMKDLKLVCRLEGKGFNDKKHSVLPSKAMQKQLEYAFYTHIHNRLNTASKDDIRLKSDQFSNNEATLEVLAKIKAKQCTYQAYQSLSYYYLDSTQRKIKGFVQPKTYTDLVSPQVDPFFSVFAPLLVYLDI